MISTFTLMGCSQALFAMNLRIRTSLFNTFHLCDQIGLPWNNLFSNCIVWTDHTLNIMQKETNHLLVMPFERSIFLLASIKKSIFYCFGSNQYLGNFIAIFPSIIMLLLIIHLIYNFLSVVLLLPDPVFRSYCTNNAKMIYIRI